MAVKINYKGSSLDKGLDRMSMKIGTAVLMYANTKAAEIQSKMKVNRPWTDRTGMAKATLTTVVSQPEPATIRVTLAHGVDYGVWLELAHEKNYAIIQPTIKEEGPKFVKDLNGIMNKIR